MYILDAQRDLWLLRRASVGRPPLLGRLLLSIVLGRYFLIYFTFCNGFDESSNKDTQ